MEIEKTILQMMERLLERMDAKEEVNLERIVGLLGLNP
jgi:hypothetical protein